MKFILNILWLVLCGFWMALGYVLAGVICCILIVTIPFGIASFRIAGYALWPFGRTTPWEAPEGAGGGHQRHHRAARTGKPPSGR
ncbi:YccF domain-containing protein, partial [Streptomyces noursei]